MKNKTRILIVDDNADVRADLRVLLNLAEKTEVIGEAATSREAILLTESHHPDIIVMDLEMSRANSEEKIFGGIELDGIRTIQNIKESQPETLIFVLTVHDYDQAVKAAKEAGADAFLVKGRDTAQLLELIKNLQNNEITKMASKNSK